MAFAKTKSTRNTTKSKSSPPTSSMTTNQLQHQDLVDQAKKIS
eukprot:CAMPEP_0195257782 /NCGR_PEP_ID=MMETSP0706-20130129/7013_1 /TAXON_ID=33640 /ORGANISM="Asterionellopsis glacialis, Strain CCMP134" /LENGTH=42 /DNA_ID= /DNA_START= /DNA_END= /DNA_ORIENTATION=